MDKQVEVPKIQDILKIPVTDIEVNDANVQVISGDSNIGGMPYYSVADVITYDNSENVLNWLAWDAVYDQNKGEIDSLIVELLETDEIVIKLGTFRNLYISNQEGDLICKANCAYGDKWTVTRVS